MTDGTPSGDGDGTSRPVPLAPPLAPHAAGLHPVEWRFPKVHPEGYRFAGIAAAGAVIAFLFLDSSWLGWLLLLAAAAIAAFFRDPERASPKLAGGDTLVLAPADGLVTQICTAAVPAQLVGDGLLGAGCATRVSIFMSVFDVHVNRAPIAGTVRRIAYVPGKYLNASLDKASAENERQYMLVEHPSGLKVGFAQIAGLVARRIVSFVQEGVEVGAGERVGLIRFGSRVDVYLPDDVALQVVKGQRAVAGETVLAATGRPEVGGATVQ